MSDGEKEGNGEANQRTNPRNRDALSGTTRRVYRYIYKSGPVRPHEIQRQLRLSSSSQVDYHIRKLLEMKLIREEEAGSGSAGYVAEEAVFEAMLRIKRTVIPLWTTATALFASALVVLLTILRPDTVDGLYLFSLVITLIALAISAYEALNSLRSDQI